MNTCKNCRWWNADERMEWRGVCDKVGQHGMDHDSSFEIEATAADDHNLSARLITGPEFGCNQFAPTDRLSIGNGWYPVASMLPPVASKGIPNAMQDSDEVIITDGEQQWFRYCHHPRKAGAECEWRELGSDDVLLYVKVTHWRPKPSLP